MPQRRPAEAGSKTLRQAFMRPPHPAEPFTSPSISVVRAAFPLRPGASAPAPSKAHSKSTLSCYGAAAHALISLPSTAYKPPISSRTGRLSLASPCPSHSAYGPSASSSSSACPTTTASRPAASRPSTPPPSAAKSSSGSSSPFSSRITS